MQPASHATARSRSISLVLAYALIITLFAPFISSRAQASGKAQLMSSSASEVGAGWWSKLLALFLGAGMDQAQGRGMPTPSQPRPVIVPPVPPPTTEELRARVARIELSASAEVMLAPGQRLAVSAVPVDFMGRAVHTQARRRR